jgi:hypothetical protein
MRSNLRKRLTRLVTMPVDLYNLHSRLHCKLENDLPWPGISMRVCSKSELVNEICAPIMASGRIFCSKPFP